MAAAPCAGLGVLVARQLAAAPAQERALAAACAVGAAAVADPRSQPRLAALDEYLS